VNSGMPCSPPLDSIGPSEDDGIVAVEGDIADPETAQRIVEAAVEQFGRIDTLINAGMGALHPIGRVGKIEDVVGGVLYLESAPFVTGEILHIDGGQSAGH
jgi:NAD(P)-dependent dehydrogenase (short-subunit alcohol dehydrogenase family)